MTTVRIIQARIPEYRYDFFIQLIRKGLSDDIAYSVTTTSYNDFRAVVTKYPELKDSFYFAKSVSIGILGKSLLLPLINDYEKYKLNITEHAFANLTYLKPLFSKSGKYFLAFWGHGATYTKKSFNWLESFKFSLARKSDLYFVYTQGGADRLLNRGLNRNKIIVVQNSSQVELKEQEAQGKTKSSLQSEDTAIYQDTAIYIGSTDASKKIDFLLEACQLVHNEFPSFKLRFFTSSKMSDHLSRRITNLPFVENCGKADNESFGDIANSGHFILCPGRVGLIAVDSMHLALPIITTSWKYHAPEMEYLEVDKDFLVSQETTLEYSSLISQIVSGKIQLTSFRKSLVDKSHIYTIENMVSNFHNGVKTFCLENEPK